MRPSIVWNGLALGGDSPFRLQTVDGWEDMPSGRSSDAPRSRSHGEHQGQFLVSGRTVTAAFLLAERDATDDLVDQLETATPVQADELDELAITMFGRTLTVQARVQRRTLPQDLNYGAGVHKLGLQWHAPDPLRYGEPQSAQSTGLPTAGGGLEYPLTYGLAYGDPGEPGQVVLVNPGTAPAPIQAEVTGPHPQGFELSGNGQRIVFAGDVPAGQVISIDTATGAVLAEGTADRRGYVISADWIHVPAKGTLTLQYVSRGGYDPAATLTIPGFRAAYW